MFIEIAEGELYETQLDSLGSRGRHAGLRFLRRSRPGCHSGPATPGRPRSYDHAGPGCRPGPYDPGSGCYPSPHDTGPGCHGYNAARRNGSRPRCYGGTAAARFQRAHAYERAARPHGSVHADVKPRLTVHGQHVHDHNDGPRLH